MSGASASPQLPSAESEGVGGRLSCRNSRKPRLVGGKRELDSALLSISLPAPRFPPPTLVLLQLRLHPGHLPASRQGLVGGLRGQKGPWLCLRPLLPGAGKGPRGLEQGWHAPRSHHPVALPRPIPGRGQGPGRASPDPTAFASSRRWYSATSRPPGASSRRAVAKVSPEPSSPPSLAQLGPRPRPPPPACGPSDLPSEATPSTISAPLQPVGAPSARLPLAAVQPSPPGGRIPRSLRPPPAPHPASSTRHPSATRSAAAPRPTCHSPDLEGGGRVDQAQAGSEAVGEEETPSLPGAKCLEKDTHRSGSRKGRKSA